MKTKSIIIIFAAVLIAALLLGATGAISVAGSETAGEAASGDRLVGVLVTTEYLDLFDFESWFNDNSETITSGGEADTGGYEGRLYAVLKDETYVNEDSGEESTSSRYVFEGVDGIAFFCVKMSDEDGDYYASNGGDGISDSSVKINSTDDGDSFTLEGTVYAAPGGIDKAVYINPVYQSADGRVYAMSGNGMSFGDTMDEGGVYTQTLEDSVSVTENGVASTESCKVTISVSVMLPPEKIAVVQFDADGGVVSRDEYEPGSAPEALTPLAGTEYVVVEIFKSGGGVDRELYGRSDTGFCTFRCRDDGIMVQTYSALEWPDAAQR